MTERTEAQLKDEWSGTDPKQQFTNLLDSISAIVDEVTDKHVHVHPGGSDSEGDGSILQPYKSIGTALANIGASKQSVLIWPGTYTENLTWPSPGDNGDGVRLIGIGRQGAIEISDPSSGGTAVIKVAPGTATVASFDVYVENVKITHNGTGLHLDNTDMDKNLVFYGNDVEFNAAGGTSVLTTHGNASDAIHIYLNGGGQEIGGEINLTIKDAGDRIRIRNMVLAEIVTSADDKAAEITLMQCELPHAGAASGGHESQLLASIGCWSRTGTTLAAADTNEFTGSHAETII